jgi:hypothetical protein
MNYAAIDPMALILSEKAYLIWVEIHHPHVPAVEDLGKLFKRMSAAEGKAVLARAKTVAAYAKAVQDAASKQ